LADTGQGAAWNVCFWVCPIGYVYHVVYDGPA
jgi:hypothetical protein